MNFLGLFKELNKAKALLPCHSTLGHLLGILYCQLLAKEGTGAAGGSVWASYVTHILPYSQEE